MRFQFAQFTFDSDALELRRSDELVPLQPKVLGLLGHLLAHADRTVGKSELLDALWPGVSVGEDSLFRVVSLARRALDDGSGRPILETRRGVGHRIGVPVHVQKTREELAGDSVQMGPSRGPAVAVLPFERAGDDADDEYFADGLAEDLISRLSRVNRFPVIASASSFQHRKMEFDPARVGAALGARYLVTGRVRRDDERVRVTAHLIEAASGHTLWSDRYDQPLGELFAAQDALAEALCAAIAPNLTNVERRRALQRNPDNLDAWETLLRGEWHLYRYTETDHVIAERLLRHATELDPLLAPAWSAIANAIFIEVYYGWSEDPVARVKESAAAGQRAVDADPNLSSAWFTVAWAHLFMQEHEPARAAAERALELNASNAAARWAHGVALTGLGEPAAAVAELEEAIRLSPLDPALRLYFQNLGIAQLMAERYEDAIASARRSLSQNAEQPAPHRLLAACYGHLGRPDDAASAMDEAMRLAPSFTLAELERINDAAIVARLREGWEKAGVGP